MLTLVIGGVRSGKSELAERLADARVGTSVIFLATYLAPSVGDPEMAARVARHRERRPLGWRTVEASDPLAAFGDDLSGAAEATLLVDNLSGWLAVAMAGDQPVLPAIERFAGAAAARAGQTIVVADETGLGGVAPHPVARSFADVSGEACQLLAAAATEVWLVVAGQPLALKGPAAPAPNEPAAPAPNEPAAPAPNEPAAPAPNEPAAPAPNEPAAPAPNEPAAPAPNEPAAPAPNEPAAPAPNEPAAPAWLAGPGPDLAALAVHGDTEGRPGELDFAVNVLPGGPPPAIAKVLAAAVEQVDRYPDDGPATRALAARHGRSPEEVLPLNGAAEAFWLLAGLAVHRAVCVHPSFTEPELALRSRGVPVVRAFRDPVTFALVPAAVDAEADLVVTGNPNNPTGTLDPARVLATLAKPGRLLVVDEAFMDLVPGQAESLASRGDLPGTVVVRSLTKVLGLPGLRAGYLVGPAEVVACLRSVRQRWSVSAPALAVLEAYATGDGETELVAAATAAERGRLAGGLSRLPGAVVWPSAANFLLLRVPDGPATRDALHRCGIAVRRGDSFPGLTPNHLRVAVRTGPENDLLIQGLHAVLTESIPGQSTP